MPGEPVIMSEIKTMSEFVILSAVKNLNGIKWRALFIFIANDYKS
jgi:hypothetical protein